MNLFEKFKVLKDLEYKRKNISIDRKIVKSVTSKIDNRNIYYKTKGDYNEKEDDFLVNSKLVIGQEKFRILFLEIPSVTINELLQKL